MAEKQFPKYFLFEERKTKKEFYKPVNDWEDLKDLKKGLDRVMFGNRHIVNKKPKYAEKYK